MFNPSHNLATSNRKVLVVSNDVSTRQLIIQSLTSAGIDYTEATNGKTAIQIVKDQVVDLIVADSVLEDLFAHEILHSKEVKNKAIPIVAVSDVSVVTDTSDNHYEEIDSFIIKPIHSEYVIQVIQDALRRKNIKSQHIRDESNQYCGIPIEEFLGNYPIQSAIYLKISNNKFVRVGHTSDDLLKKNIEALISKKVRYLYLNKNDYKKHISLVSARTNELTSNQSVNAQKKAKILRSTSEIILEFGFQQYVDSEIFEFAKNNIDQSLDLLASESDIVDILDQLTSLNNLLYSHSVGVTLVSSLITKALSWTSSPMHFRVVGAGIFHDIGKKFLPEELITKPTSQMTPEELTTYQKHSEKGAKYLSMIESLPHDISQIVLHHHELSDGSGFPAGLTKMKIHPIAKVIGTADEFFKLFRGETSHGPRLTPEEAIQKMDSRNSTIETSAVKWEHLPELKTIFNIKT